MTYKSDCRWFSGYKPCKFKRACEACPHYDQPSERIAILSLEAMGAVLRSTCLLPAIKRSYPNSHITWITLKSARPLLDNNPFLDRILVADSTMIHAIEYLEFDLLLAVDKSMEAGALAEKIRAKEKRGFGLNKLGSIVPLNSEASYQYQVGLDDELKFFINQKAETQQITETMGLEWRRDPYVLELSESELQEMQKRKRLIQPHGSMGIIGFNTGCSILFPYKKFTVERSIEVIRSWRSQFPFYTVALLGGPEDFERQALMKEAFADDPWVVNTPTREGLRSGVIWMATADLVLSGCSLGLHIAIALKKPVIAWFGVSCIQEIDVYDKGIKLQSEVTCSPCWKKSCDNSPKCFDRVSPVSIMEATQTILDAAKT